jgi:hypothetical protein
MMRVRTRPLARDPLPHLGDQVAHEADLVGIAIGMGTQGHDQAAAQIQGDQGSPPQQAAGDAPQRLEPLGHSLDGLAIEDHDLVVVQALWDGGLRLRFMGIDLVKPSGTLGQEGGAHRDRDPPQLAIGGAEGGFQLAAVLGLLEALTPAAAVFEEGIADQRDDQGEGEDLLVTAAAVLVEDLIESISVSDPPPQGQDGLGQGEPGQDLASWSLQRPPPGKKDLLIFSLIS